MPIQLESIEVDPDLGFRVHPFAGAFPMMDGAEFAELVEDIRTNGLLEPIQCVIDGGGNNIIIDGRNRLKACLTLELPPDFDWQLNGKTDAELLTYVWSRNIHRRHLNASQRAMLIAEQEKLVAAIEDEKTTAKKAALKRGSKKAARSGTGAGSGTTAETLAKTAGVSERTMRDALTVRKSKDEKQIKDVKSGRTSAKAAAKAVREKRPRAASTSGASSKAKASGARKKTTKRPTKARRPDLVKKAAQALLDEHGVTFCRELIVALDELLTAEAKR